MNDTSSSVTQQSLPPRTCWNRLLGVPGLFGLFVLLLDQLTKIIIDRSAPHGWSKPVIPDFFNLVHWRNTGAAWGIFGQHTWLLGLVSLTCLIALLVFFEKLACRRTIPALLLGTLAGGIAGNMIDRFFRASVIDFLDFHWHETYHYPAFNVADIAICVATALLVIWSFFEERKENRTQDKDGQA